MKKVSFKVAKALKEAGYWKEQLHEDYPIEQIDANTIRFNTSKCIIEYGLPTYLEVWLWLWKVKKIAIPADYFGYENNYWESCVPIGNDKFEFFSSKEGPEEAIIAAIEYLCNNNLIK